MKAVMLIPFGYTVLTRIQRPKDFLYLLATQILPGILLLYWLDASLGAMAAPAYLLGYLAFISIYELGYLANDGWDARRSAAGRRRLDFDVSLPFCGLFVVIRLALFATLLVAAPERSELPAILAGFTTLAAVFLVHNLAQGLAVKLATFTQLAILRFTLPVTFTLGTADLLQVIAISVLYYLPFRLLTYLESKGKLLMPERQASTFGLYYMATMSPLCLLLAHATADLIYLVLLGFHIAVNLTYHLGGKLLSARADR
jgi:hypothetical protein